MCSNLAHSLTSLWFGLGFSAAELQPRRFEKKYPHCADVGMKVCNNHDPRALVPWFEFQGELGLWHAPPLSPLRPFWGPLWVSKFPASFQSCQLPPSFYWVWALHRQNRFLSHLSMTSSRLRKILRSYWKEEWRENAQYWNERGVRGHARGYR